MLRCQLLGNDDDGTDIAASFLIELSVRVVAGREASGLPATANSGFAPLSDRHGVPDVFRLVLVKRLDGLSVFNHPQAAHARGPVRSRQPEGSCSQESHDDRRVSSAKRKEKLQNKVEKVKSE